MASLYLAREAALAHPCQTSAAPRDINLQQDLVPVGQDPGYDTLAEHELPPQGSPSEADFSAFFSPVCFPRPAPPPSPPGRPRPGPLPPGPGNPTPPHTPRREAEKSPPLEPPKQPQQKYKIKRRPVPGSWPTAEQEPAAPEPAPPPSIELTAPAPAPATASAAAQEPRRGMEGATGEASSGAPPTPLPAMEFRWYCDMYPLHPACCEVCFPGARATSVPGISPVSSMPPVHQVQEDGHPRRGGPDDEEGSGLASSGSQREIWDELWGGLRQRHPDVLSPQEHTGSAPPRLPPLSFQATAGHGERGDQPARGPAPAAARLQEPREEYGWCVDVDDDEAGVLLEPAAETELRRGLPGRYEGNREGEDEEEGRPPTPPPKDR
ncbi:uncharacterized protein E0L32_012109 [Thyridium curvatum]|uniref:Uncharacterized protein n=1 Tax=Thyridium curvatum TaxID=1093900 RepID=A0A507BJN4_9PEZI|nr:uncharacterized protein E0L32_012109 [Thyridium curvatum]TPX17599.1 hypothetical protein E0L32_012109 [Thyridium curvatum]